MLILEADADPASLDARLDEKLAHEVDAAEAERLEVRRIARENRDALQALAGLRVK